MVGAPVGRASAGVTVQAIGAMLQSAAAETLASGQYGRDPRLIVAWGGKSRPVPAMDRLVRLAGTVATVGGLCLLAIACTNVGLAFAALLYERRSERAVRTALGAGRGRLMLEGIAELGSLAGMGGLTGLMLAGAGLTAAGRLQPQVIPGVSATIAPSLDWRVVAFGLGLTVLAAALCCLVGLELLGEGRSKSALTPGAFLSRPRPKWFSDVLTASHVTATVVLLSVAFQLDRTLLAELSKGVGFDQDHLAFARLQIVPRSPGATPDLSTALQRLSELPAVASVTTSNAIPFAADAERPCASVEVDGRSGLNGCHVQVGPAYFETLGLRLLRGKGLQAGLDADAAVVSAAAARSWWPGADPVGRTFMFDHRRLTVVGVATDANHGFPAGIEQPFIYVTAPPSSRRAVTYVVVRSQTSGLRILSPMNQVLRETLPAGVTVTQIVHVVVLREERPPVRGPSVRDGLDGARGGGASDLDARSVRARRSARGCAPNGAGSPCGAWRRHTTIAGDLPRPSDDGGGRRGRRWDGDQLRRVRLDGTVPPDSDPRVTDDTGRGGCRGADRGGRRVLRGIQGREDD